MVKDSLNMYKLGNGSELPRSVLKVQSFPWDFVEFIFYNKLSILTLCKVASAATPSNYPCLIGKNTKQRALRKITLSIIIIIIIIIIIYYYY